MSRSHLAVVHRRRSLLLWAIVGFAALASTFVFAKPANTRRRANTPKHSPVRSPLTLRAGSDPWVLPGPVLIADEGNDRLLEVSPSGQILWEFPRPGDLSSGQTFASPDDAFYSPDGTQIAVTQEDDFVISVVDIASRRIVWRYGTPGVHGAGPNQLWNPDDAIMIAGGRILTADIKNCRLLLIDVRSHRITQQFGRTGHCSHRPPLRFSSPNGLFPAGQGRYLVTEIGHDWVDEIDLNGFVYFAVHPPNVAYPSDTNLVRPGEYLTVDYSKPGQIVMFDRAGKLLWRFAPRGPDALDEPSLALALPNGDILCNDDHNDRVIVVDPHTNRIVWQYGHTGVAGRGTGYLDTPDGVELAPPNHFVRRAGV